MQKPTEVAKGIAITSSFTISELISDGQQDDHYVVSYVKKFDGNIDSFYEKFDEKREKKVIPRAFKIRKSDLEETGLSRYSQDLYDYIQSKLIILMGVDFDKTLTESDDFDNAPHVALKGGELAKKIFHDCAQNSSLYLFIASLNSKDTIERRLEQWGLSTYFKEIRDGHNIVHDLSNLKGNKAGCFTDICLKSFNETAIDNDGFLDFNSDHSIDVVGSILIDDRIKEVNKKQMEQSGIDVLVVNPHPKHVGHLEYLNSNYLQNRFSDDVAVYQKQYKTQRAVDDIIQLRDDTKNIYNSEKTKDVSIVPPLVYNWLDEKMKTFIASSTPLEVTKRLIAVYKEKYPNVMEFDEEVNSSLPGWGGNNFSHTFAHFIALTRDEESIKLVVKEGFSFNFQDYSGNTPLHFLIGADSSKETYELPSYSLISYLINEKVDFNVRNKSGKSFQDLLVYDHRSPESLRLVAYIYANAKLDTDLETFKQYNRLLPQQCEYLDSCLKEFQGQLKSIDSFLLNYSNSNKRSSYSEGTTFWKSETDKLVEDIDLSQNDMTYTR